jgi:succinyl-CoA synthetase beta subunit
MGLQGSLIEAVSSVIEKMYHLFVQYDLDLIEINPLGVSASGNVMALDGKVSVNDDALGRHPHLVSLISKLGGNPADPTEATPVTIDSEGTIGLVCNGAGLTMAILDLVCQAGGKPASFLNIGGETQWDASPDLLKQRLEQGLDLMGQNKQVRVILVNLLSNLVPCDEIAEIITTYCQRRTSKVRPLSDLRPDTLIAQANRSPTLVVRLVGCQSDRARELLATVSLSLVDDLDETVTQTVALAKASRSA